MTDFNWVPLSDKQLLLFNWWRDHKKNPYKNLSYIIAHGSIRSGKTCPMSCSFIHWSMNNYNNAKFGIAGKTIGSCRRNVIYDLKIMLAGQGYHVKDSRHDNTLLIADGYHQNLYHIFGGKDESSQDIIQGITLGGILLDEAVLMPESFVNQAIGRCSLPGFKIWMNCNPGGPFHYIKQRFIDKADYIRALVTHHLLDDNPALSEEVKENYRRTYAGTIWYKRYILGQWVAAEGIIYDMFSDKHVGDFSGEVFDNYLIGIDYATSSVLAMGLYGYHTENRIIKLKELYYDARKERKQLSDAEIFKELIKFKGDLPIRAYYIDPSAASLRLIMRNSGMHCPTVDNDVVPGIRFVSGKLNSFEYLMDRVCKNSIREKETYSWCPKAQARGEDKPIKENDHATDEERYVLFNHFGKDNEIDMELW